MMKSLFALLMVFNTAAAYASSPKELFDSLPAASTVDGVYVAGDVVMEGMRFQERSDQFPVAATICRHFRAEGEDTYVCLVKKMDGARAQRLFEDYAIGLDLVYSGQTYSAAERESEDGHIVCREVTPKDAAPQYACYSVQN